LASWLVTADPVPLVFDDEPNRTYYAVVQNTIDDFSRMERSVLRQGTIQFLCLDPYGYGQQHTYNLSPTVAVEGTTETYPTFDLTVKKDTPLISIANRSNMDDYGDPLAVILGTDVSVDEEPQERKTLILHDTMQSTSGWTGAENVDSGYVTGQMGVDDEGFYVERWGDE